MTQEPTQQLSIVVRPEFAAAIPQEPESTREEKALAALAVSPEKRDQLVCKDLLVGETRKRAEKEAADVLPKIMSNTQVLAVFGTDAIEAVNRLNDRMLRERPPVNVPELEGIMKDLSRRMRGLGSKYDPSDPKVLEKYEKVKGGILARFGLVRTFFQEFMDDIRDLPDRFDVVEDKLHDKQTQLLRNVSYYDEFYNLNEEEVEKLIYTIGVMETVRDMAAQKAADIKVGDSSMGDRGEEEQARIAELVSHLENKIIAFKSRLWVAWAMAPQIRNMRAISLGLSARIDETVGVTIPSMKNVINIWLTLSEAQQAEQLNKAVEDAYNNALTMFANAAKVTVPAIANAIETPALDPSTVAAWSDSLSAQADGIIQAIEQGRQKRAELETSLISSKGVMDVATLRINQARLESVLETARKTSLEIARSVPAA